MVQTTVRPVREALLTARMTTEAARASSPEVGSLQRWERGLGSGEVEGTALWREAGPMPATQQRDGAAVAAQQLWQWCSATQGSTVPRHSAAACVACRTP